MRISDWSSDVCSSDLRAPRHDNFGVGLLAQGPAHRLPRLPHRLVSHRAAVEDDRAPRARRLDGGPDGLALGDIEPATEIDDLQIGRASCRARVCQYV